MDMLIKPGHKNVIKGTPKTFPRYSPIERFKTDQNRSVSTSGLKIVWIQTFSILSTSFLHKVVAPIQFTDPNLGVFILYFLLISTIRSLITSKNKISVKNFFLQ